MAWAAYEAGIDAGKPKEFNLEPRRTTCASSRQNRRSGCGDRGIGKSRFWKEHVASFFNSGPWHQFQDRPEIVEAWFARHSKIGLAFQSRLTRSKTPHLPILTRMPSVADVVVWKQEPAWPRFPQMVSGRTVYLADVGDAEPIRITQQFVQPIDIDALGIRGLFAT
jgi:hypothetical protein